MPKSAKSQWDFGELFEVPSRTAPARSVLSVAELTVRIRRLLENEVGRVWVTGEITNLRAQSSGHIYFTLKDASAQLSCVLFRGEVQVDRGLLGDGKKVILGGEVTVYEPRGQYQLRVAAVEMQGVGALQVAFEKLKQKLKAEGLFAPERKRPLPRYPQRIGLVTSPSGAAIRDVLHVVERRNPGLEMILAPCRVQGEGAAEEIAAAIRLLNEYEAAQASAPPGKGRHLDLILLTRGGGSLEDLWAFNEEAVARAIFESSLPVVSAVGHEIDFTISDFVADVRAATPSAAAEIITEGVFSSCQFVSEAAARIRQLTGQQVADKRRSFSQAGQRLARVHPRRRFNEWLQRLDDLQTGLWRCLKQGARQQRTEWRNLAERLWRVRPALLLKQRREAVGQFERELQSRASQRLREWRGQVDTLRGRLRLLGPEQVLARGYSITMDAQTGAVLRQASALKPGQQIKTRLQVGEIHSRIERD
jgi:exodeoxyribonuclease VII large subunit